MAKLLNEDGSAILNEDGTAILADIPSFALVAFAQASASTCTVGATTPPVDTTGATNLFVAIANAIGVSVPTFVDSKGNVYKQLDTYTVTENRLTIFHCPVTPATVGAGHTITVPTNGAACPAVHFLAFSADGNFAYGPFAHAYVNGAALSPGSITPPVSNSLVLAIACNANVGGTFAIDSSFTIIQQLSCGSGQHYGLCSAWKVQTAPATEAPLFTFTGAANSTAFIMSFGEHAPTGADVSTLPLLVLGQGPAPVSLSAAPLLVLSGGGFPPVSLSAAPLLVLHSPAFVQAVGGATIAATSAVFAPPSVVREISYARLTQEVVEVWNGGPATVRETQIAVEVFAFIPIPVRETQAVVELWQGGPAAARTTQTIVELWVTLPPCTNGDFPVDNITPPSRRRRRGR